MPARLRDIAFAVLPFVGLALAGPTATPYSDGECNTQMAAWSYTARNGTKYYNQPFDTGAGVSAYNNATLKGNYESYGDLKFSSAAASDSLGSGIYWKFSELDSSCRVIFMAPYAQTQHGTNIPGKDRKSVV